MMKDKELVEICSASRCLIVAPSWVGDMVMAQVLFRALKEQFPGLTIDVLAPSWCVELIEFMPEVNKGIVVPFEHGKLGLKARWRLAKSLRGQYDVAFVLPNSLKSAIVPWLAKVPMRIGFLGEQRYGILNLWQKLNKQALPTMCQRFTALAKPKGANVELSDVLSPKFQVSKKKANIEFEKRFKGEITDSKIVALFPGAEFGVSKQWPSEHYATVARYFVDNGYAVWLFGSKSDGSVCQCINVKTKNRCIDFSGQTLLSEAVKLISLVDIAISNDSGLMHVAAALDKPLVAIYGSTDPSFTPPMHSTAEIVRLGLECSPCFKRECPLKHLDCLTKLLPKQVLEASKRLLKK